MNNQIHKRLIRGQANEKGWRPVVEIEGEILAPAAGRSIAHLIHISDIHICDAQSPARVEALDRFADPHNPLSKLIPLVGTYRAQEILTAQTFEALIRKINAISHGVMCDRLVDAVVITGDVTDNAQQNELKWYLDILHGKLVIPDSGDLTKWEGASTTNAHRYDPSYWNPEGTPPGCEDDFPRARYGFPEIKGLTEAIRAPFIAQGLQHPWFSTHGNHDALLQGTVPPNEELRSFATGDQRLRGLKPETDLVTLFSTFNEVGPANYPNPETVITEKVTPDLQRGFNSRTQWNEIHTTCGHDHGYRAGQTEKYWARDIENLRMISLDTVNHNGGWQGSLSREQFEWLKRELKNPDPHYFVILSHHPAGDLFNLYDPNNEGRVGEKEVVELLLAEPRVILWLAGHRHQHKIDLYTANDSAGFWHIKTASNIDWPQQGRAIEILETESEVLIVTHVFDHLGERDPDLNVTDFDWRNLAGISRLLAANDWQRRSGNFFIEKNEGSRSDRNVILKRAK